MGRLESAILFGAMAASLMRAPPARGQEQPTEIKRWNRFGAVFDVRQDPSGQILIGTADGAYAFDGVNFAPLSRLDVEGQRKPVRAVLPTRGGDLWLATGPMYTFHQVADPSQAALIWPPGEGGLVRVQAGKHRSFGASDGLPSDRITTLTESGDGQVWVGTDLGLARVVGDRFVRVQVGNTREAPITAVAERGDTLWVATLQGLWAGTRDGLTWRQIAKGLKATSIQAGENGTSWISSYQGLWRGNDRAKTVRHVAIDRMVSDAVADGVEGAFALTHGNAHHVDADGHVSVMDDMPAAQRLLVDREGSLWAATRLSGLVQRLAARVTNVMPRGASDVTFSVLPVPDGAVWFSSVSGLSRWHNGTTTTFPTMYTGPAASQTRSGLTQDSQKRVPVGQIRSIAQTTDGVLWGVALDQGLVRTHGNVSDPAFRFEKVSSDQLPGMPMTLFADRAGKLWVGWHDGAVSRLDSMGPPLVWRTWNTANGTCSGEPQEASAHDAHTVWFAGSGGLTQIANDQATCLTEMNGLPLARLNSVSADPHHGLWIAPHIDARLIYLRQGRMNQITVEGTWGPFFGVTLDATGALWLSSALGIARISSRQINEVMAGERHTVHPLAYGVQDGMQVAECTANFAPKIAVDRTGRVWAPTLMGAVRIFPTKEATGGVHPVVQGFAVDGVEQPAANVVALPHAASTLEVRYTVPTFLAPHRIELAHRLVGVDPVWVNASAQRVARYGALPAGRHTFEVRATDDFERPLGGLAVVTVIVPSPWHRNPWLMAAAFLAVVGLARLVHVRRVRAAHARQNAIDEERRRIARDLHDGLAQGFAAARIQIEVAKRSLLHPETAVTTALAAADEALGTTQGEVHRAIWALRSRDPQGVSVTQLLARLARHTASVAGLTIKVKPSDVTAVLVGDKEEDVERILREAITNAIKHARPALITLHAAQQGDALVFEVIDDGIGMPDSSPAHKNAVGWLGMRERAARLRASLEVTSSAGQGTLVRLTLAHHFAGEGAAQ